MSGAWLLTVTAVEEVGRALSIDLSAAMWAPVAPPKIIHHLISLLLVEGAAPDGLLISQYILRHAATESWAQAGRISATKIRPALSVMPGIPSISRPMGVG